MIAPTDIPHGRFTMEETSAIVFSILMLQDDGHVEKAFFPIDVTLSGNVILVSFSHSLNALAVIDVIGPLMVIPVRFLHPRKAPSPIEETFSGMTMLSRPEFVNALFPIDSTDLGILMDFKPEQS